MHEWYRLRHAALVEPETGSSQVMGHGSEERKSDKSHVG